MNSVLLYNIYTFANDKKIQRFKNRNGNVCKKYSEVKNYIN